LPPVECLNQVLQLLIEDILFPSPMHSNPNLLLNGYIPKRQPFLLTTLPPLSKHGCMSHLRTLLS
jgi:hypothetical protein